MTTSSRAITADVLTLDAEKEVERICAWMVDTVAKRLHRRGVIIATE